jgi:undecaprenyl-diphosphatase
LPRTSRAQARVGKAIRQNDIEPGDLIFFRRDRYSDNRIGHVGYELRLRIHPLFAFFTVLIYIIKKTLTIGDPQHMNNKLKVTYVLVIGFICLLFFILIAWMIGANRISSFDTKVIAAVQGLETPFLTHVMKFFTFIGSTPLVITISIVILFSLYKVLHHRSEITLFVVLLVGSAILNTLLKLAFHRQRPTLHRLIEETSYSFPSGHSMGAFSLYAGLAFLLWRHLPTQTARYTVIAVSIFMILAIGISRIYLGVHFPSDVIGAYCASGCWFALSVWYFQWYKENRYDKKHKK